jgi:predicted  nucleic acid-binding Zn-ribbon protein
MQTDLELKEGVRQIKIALETAASEVTELQEEVELLRANEKHLNEALQAAETRCANYQRALESAIADFDRQKRSSSRSHAKDVLTERQALARKLDEEVAGPLAGIKTGLESMHKMAGKSPLGLRLQESVNSLENARQKIRSLAKGLVTTGGL